MASPPGTAGRRLSDGVRKCGYLRKHKHGHRRFFVLKEPAEGSPARLEYYDSEKKWRCKGAAKRIIGLDSCLCVNKRADAKHKHLVALYTKDEYFAVAADSEQDQESWYGVLTDLLTEGRVYDSPASTSSLVGFEEASYGPVAPSAYKEVWQVNLKSKGLGQVKNLTGVFRLCLSSRTISFVKLNSETAAVCLQLMNIRRCGHSDSFFFIEVGRSAVTGPGEFWMQAEDSVVAQNIHETILESMKELSEFRPRSKSQSASTNPISVPLRRNLNNLPPSQTGLVRRSRTDNVAATSPGRKFTSCRVRTSSEGDGSVSWPVSAPTPGTASPSSPNAGRSLSSGRSCRMLESSTNLHHSLSILASHSPPGASSPISVSPGYPGLCTPDNAGRPFSCSASISGSLSDTAFMLCDDLSCSPVETKFTPDSLSSTPSSRDEGAGLDKAYRKRTHSLTTPRQQKVTPPLSSASLDEYTLMRLACDGHNSASPKVSYPEDYGHVKIGSSKSSSSNLGDDGYVPMTPGVVPLSGKVDNYVPMSPMCVSAPKQIINPRVHHHGAPTGGYKNSSPCSVSLEDNGYMRMWCGSKSSTDSPDRHGEYMNMSPGKPPALQTPPDYYTGRVAYQFGSLSFPSKVQVSKTDDGSQYVMMSPQSSYQRASDSNDYSVMQPSSPSRHGWVDNTLHRGRQGRPNRLSLDTIRTLPSMNEQPPPREPRSPGEYVNIHFAGNRLCPPSMGASLSPHQESSSSASYVQLELASHPQEEAHPDLSMRPSLEEDGVCHLGGEKGLREGTDVESDYTERSYGMASSPPQLVPQGCPSRGRRRLPEEPAAVPEAIGVFLLEGAAPCLLDPVCSAKVIRAHPQGRRRHSSETFSSTATVTPVFPSFACGQTGKRHSSVENVSSRSSEGSDEEYGSPVHHSGGYPHGLDYIALNLLEDERERPVGFKAASCKGGVGAPYACLGFKEAATTAED